MIPAVRTLKLKNCVDYTVRTEFTVIVELSPLPLLNFAKLLSLISNLMVTCLDDRMVNTHNGQAGAEIAQGNGSLPPPPSLAQAITSILESRDEQTELLCQLMANCAHGGNGARNAPAPAPTTYGDFAATHPPLFTEAGEPLEADHWIRWSPSSGSYASPKCRRPSSSRSSCVGMPAGGGPTTPPLAPRITKYRGLGSAMRSAPTTSPPV
jgi:hypothetical protein